MDGLTFILIEFKIKQKWRIENNIQPKNSKMVKSIMVKINSSKVNLRSINQIDFLFL